MKTYQGLLLLGLSATPAFTLPEASTNLEKRTDTRPVFTCPTEPIRTFAGCCSNFFAGASDVNSGTRVNCISQPATGYTGDTTRKCCAVYVENLFRYVYNSKR